MSWYISDTKNGDALTIPLSAEACAILRTRFEKKTNDFVFPVDGKTGHLISPKKGWKRILNRIALYDLIELVGRAKGYGHEQLERIEQSARKNEARALVSFKAMAEQLSIDTSDVGVKDLRIHDLRRTLGSWQAATGASLAIIGKSLGHKDVSTTAIYARLNPDPVRQAMETATNAILAAANFSKSAEVIPLSQRKRVAN